MAFENAELDAASRFDPPHPGLGACAIELSARGDVPGARAPAMVAACGRHRSHGYRYGSPPFEIQGPGYNFFWRGGPLHEDPSINQPIKADRSDVRGRHAAHGGATVKEWRWARRPARIAAGSKARGRRRVRRDGLPASGSVALEHGPGSSSRPCRAPPVVGPAHAHVQGSLPVNPWAWPADHRPSSPSRRPPSRRGPEALPAAPGRRGPGGPPGATPTWPRSPSGRVPSTTGDACP